MSLWSRLARRQPEQRAIYPLSFQEWLGYFSYGGAAYPLGAQGLLRGTSEEIGRDFTSLANGAFGANGIVFACMALRLRIFSDIRFQFREITNGRPGNLFGGIDGRNPASRGLRLLQSPWEGGTTGDLLAHMIQDVDLAGNAFVLRQADRLVRLRPDWVTIVYSSGRKDATAWDLDAELRGYLYQEGGPSEGKDPIALLPETVAHWAPMPDPLSPRRGMSWLTPVIREIQADISATQHKVGFFNNDATVNQQLVFDKGTTKEMFDYAKQAFLDNHAGPDNAYKTLFALGAKLEPVGLDFQAMDFTALQGKGETRIAAAAGVGPILTFLSEGLQGSALNAGNFGQARRAVADELFRPLWRNLCGSMAHIIDTPATAELWYDDRDCMFLQEDRKDAAEIQQILANTIANLAKEGFDPESAVQAVMSEDMSLLKHSGLLSVQLQKPGEKQDPPTNGKVPPAFLEPPDKVGAQ